MRGLDSATSWLPLTSKLAVPKPGKFPVSSSRRPKFGSSLSRNAGAARRNLDKPSHA